MGTEKLPTASKDHATMTRTLEVAERAIRLIKEKILLKTTQKITRINITPAMVEDLVNNIAADIGGGDQIATLLGQHITADMPVAVIEIPAEDIAERISTDIAADIIQTIVT